jgi:hypothetical protein
MQLKKLGATVDRKQKSNGTAHFHIYFPIFLLILMSILFFWQLINLDIFIPKAKRFDSLPISIRAGSVADYSKDLQSIVVPPINEAILNQIITEYPATGSAQDRIGTLKAVLLTPVPTMTQDRSLPATFTPHSSPTVLMTITGNPPSSPTATYPVSTSTSQPIITSTSASPTRVSSPLPTIIPPNPTNKPVPTNKPRPTRNPHQP